MTRTTTTSKQGRRADARAALSKRSTQVPSRDQSPAGLIERIVAEYARAWRGTSTRIESPAAPHAC